MTRPSLSAPFEVDLDRMLLDERHSFNPLYRPDIDIQVVAARDGYAQLSVVLPVEMARYFANLLQSTAGLFRSAGHKAKIKQASSKPVDPVELEQQAKYRQDFSNQVCILFDGFIEEGLTRNEAISRTNSTLKEQKHPWASYDLVHQTLRENLRFRKGRKTVK
ncbi:hypothetical protein SAMN05660420_02248 [Desulfuromusa kysingii]|uniref:Uncharacterized protein n=1 Tax=Desulfuromusa kysingii TaxID=37625 RepID=A0A1H4BJT7_9BACT|nr:hypothetical protein [Desulfuromusa kysingii]SEA48433.1 hypothetical protein SAMN05660420_02248 [Desulfuromusa kysingii]